MIKKVISIKLIIILIYIMTVPSIASNISELQEKKEQAENKKDEVTEEKESVLDEISELSEQISKYEDEIEKLNEKIKALGDSISEKEDEIERLEKETKEREDLLIKRLVAMYERGQTTYLDVLLSSEDITSFLSNYYRIEEIAEADQYVIDSIIEKQNESENAKQEIEQERNEINIAKEEVENKNAQLEIVKQTKEAKVDNLSKEEKELQKTIDEFEEAIEKAQKEIQQETENVVNSGGGYDGTFEGLFSWPLDYSHNIITSIYGHRDAPTIGASENHGAVDIGVSYVSLYAPADGKVIIARWLSGYGNYIMIDHGNGYYTGFGHLSGYNVSQGQTVTRGQKIATSGDTGITTGPHLHYEVYIGGTDNSYRVDPLQYTSHPNLIYY